MAYRWNEFCSNGSAVQVVQVRGNQMKGVVEAYILDQTGNEILTQTEVAINLSSVIRSEHMKLMTYKSRSFSRHRSWVL